MKIKRNPNWVRNHFLYVPIVKNRASAPQIMTYSKLSSDKKKGGMH